jgi:hypothetical protein
MSDRLLRVVVALSLALSIGFAGILQSPPVQAQVVAPGQVAGGGISFKGTSMPLPPPGKAFRFSMCEGRELLPNEVSVRCTKSNADPKWLSGGHNANYVFNTGATFLPRGVTIDGNGILSGTTGLDLTRTAVHICVLQLNETPSCGDMGFGFKVARVEPVQPVEPVEPVAEGMSAAGFVGVLGASAAGGLTVAALLKKYQEGQSSGGGSGGGGSCTAGQPSSCTSSSRCNCGYRCVTFDGAGSVGFCSP